MIADIDGGTPEIIISSTFEQKVHAFSNTGWPKEGFPKILDPVQRRLYPTPVIDDFDLDDTTELVAASTFGTLYSIKLGACNPGGMLWAAFAGNAQRTSSPALPKLDSVTPEKTKVRKDVVFRGENLGGVSIYFDGKDMGSGSYGKENGQEFVKYGIPGNLAPKKYDVTAVNSNGSSESVQLEILGDDEPDPDAPFITSLVPDRGKKDAAVEISGRNFGDTQGRSSVVFGGKRPKIQSWGPTKIVCEVPDLKPQKNKYKVYVSSDKGDSNKLDFLVTRNPAPYIKRIDPPKGGRGTPGVNIDGVNFTRSGHLYFKLGGASPKEVSCTAWDATRLTFNVPEDMEPGKYCVGLINAYGEKSNTVSFEVLPPPRIDKIQNPAAGNKATGRPGESIKIIGQYFKADDGYDVSVEFNEESAYSSLQDDKNIDCTVPQVPGGTYNVRVTNSNGKSNLFPFVVIAQPHINNISPEEGVEADTVTLTGTNFGPKESGGVQGKVRFGEKDATVLTWNQGKDGAEDEVTFKVPSDLDPKAYQVQIFDASSIPSDNTADFTVKPHITEINPTQVIKSAANPGPFTVTLTGTNFGPKGSGSGVNIGGVEATISNNGWSKTSITCTVQLDPGVYNVTVTGDAGSGPVTSEPYSSFTVIAAQARPVISQATDPAGENGPIVINGNNFGFAGTVTIGGLPLSGPVTWSDTVITGVVPRGVDWTRRQPVVVTRVDGEVSNPYMISIIPLASARAQPVVAQRKTGTSRQLRGL